MPKPKSSLAQRPVGDENYKITAFLGEESIAEKPETPLQKQPEVTAEQPPRERTNSKSNIIAKTPLSESNKVETRLSSLSDLMQNGTDTPQAGTVKRNFSVSRSNMNNIKRVVTIAGNAGARKTQDDVLNEILEDWFKSHGW